MNKTEANQPNPRSKTGLKDWSPFPSVRKNRGHLREQQNLWEERRDFIAGNYLGLSTIIGIDQKLLLGTETQEVIFRSTAHEYVKEKKQNLQGDNPGELNILFVNYGNSDRDITLPIEIAEEHSDSETQINMRFLRRPEELPSCRDELSTENSTFSTITESELAKNSLPYDLILIYGPTQSTAEDKIFLRRHADLLMDRRGENGTILISADANPADIPQEESLGGLLSTMSTRPDFAAVEHDEPVFVEMGRLSKRRRSRKPLLVGAAVVAAAATATSLLLANSSEGDPTCANGTVALTPASESVGTTVFQLADGQKVTVKIDGDRESINGSRDIHTQPLVILGQRGLTLYPEKEDKILGCLPGTQNPKAQTTSPTQSSSAQ